MGGLSPPSPFVRAVPPYEVVHLVVGIDRFARIAPEPVEDVVLHRPLGDVEIVYVGDLQLAPPRWGQRGDDVEDGLVVAVDAGDREGARRIVGLLHDLEDRKSTRL